MTILGKIVSGIFILCALYMPTSLYGTNVIFDLGGTLILPNNLSVGAAIGALDALKFYLQHGGDTGDILHTSVFKVLYGPHAQDIIQDKSGGQTIVNSKTPRGPLGLVMPEIMQDWLKGNISGPQALELALERSASYGHYTSKTEQKLVENIYRWLFNPERYVKGLKPAPGMVKLLRKVATARNEHGQLKNKVYILSNFDAPSFNKLYDDVRFGKIFTSMPRSHIFVSGNYHLMKPDPAFYDVLIKNTGIDPHDTIFIDDQKENVEAARALGMQAFWSRNHNTDGIKKALKELGVL